MRLFSGVLSSFSVLLFKGDWALYCPDTGVDFTEELKDSLVLFLGVVEGENKKFVGDLE